jgi:hypothetical protein
MQKQAIFQVEVSEENNKNHLVATEGSGEMENRWV